MQFNSETNGLDLYSDARYLCGIDETSDTTSYPIKAFTRNANISLDRYNVLILQSDGTWKFDDTNQTGELLDLTTALVSGTQKYALGATWLKIARVRIKDAQGNLKIMPPLDRQRQADSQLTATSGTPQGYFILGNYLYLDKAPNYASAGGLEVQYQRSASYFAYTDTTKTPGFALQFHQLISMSAAVRYCKVNSMAKRVADIQGDIDKMELELVNFYSSRNADEQPTLQFKQDDYGQSALGHSSSLNPYGIS